MEFKHLIYFKKVAELEHITKASEELFLSQAHLSRIIADLEKELGVKLFDHNGRGIKLNPCGLTLYQNVIKIINTLDETKRQVQTSYNKSQSQLSIVTNAGAYIPGLLLKLMEIAPNFKLRQHSAPRNDLIKKLRAGDVNFAICCPPINDELEFVSTILYTEPAVVIYPKDHWLEDCKIVSLLDLKDEAFISVAPGFGARDSIESSYYLTGVSPNFIVETGDTSSVYQYVHEGLGIAIVAKSLTKQNEFFKDHYVDIAEQASGTLAISWKRNKVFNEDEALFYRAAIEYYNDLNKYIQD